MNPAETKYSQYALVREMLETADVVRNLDTNRITSIPVPHDNILLTGEGSSRIFPAGNLICRSLKSRYHEHIITENGTQAREYNLDNYTVFVASNSGKTAEGVALIRHLRQNGNSRITGIVAHGETPIMNEADNSYLLTCGEEDAVAATKSVVEQALFYDILFRARNGMEAPDLKRLANLIEETLTCEIPAAITEILSSSPLLYFAGRNNGVAEELRLKTNEITRKKSDYLEGTYAVHGIEEVMQPAETVIIIDPFEETEEKFRKVLVEGVGMNVIAIASRETSFPTIRIPFMEGFESYIQLVAGWNLLVETGLAAGIDLDKPERARKVGNEYTG